MDLATTPPANDYVEVQSIFEPTQPLVGTSTACFDPQQELFWTGTSEGRITSYYGMGLSKYTSFRVSPPQQRHLSTDIRMLFPTNNATDLIFALTADSLYGYSRLGVRQFHHQETSFQNLQCLFLNQLERFYIGGFNTQMYDFDIERMRVLRQLSIADEQHDCIIIKGGTQNSSNTSSTTRGGGANAAGNLVCTGSTNGKIVLRDPFSLKALHKFQPHSGSLSDFDVHGNQLVSCGFSTTRTGSLAVDRFLMCYDLRMIRATTPVQMTLLEPCFLHFLPICSSIVAVASQAGCFQLIDINNPMLTSSSTLYQAQVPMMLPAAGICTTFSMSSNCHAAAFGHSSGSVHLFSKGENTVFNNYSQPTLFVDPPQYLNTNQFIDIKDELTPLSSVPMPVIDDGMGLLSDWPSKLSTKIEHRPTPRITPELLAGSRVIHGIITIPNRNNLPRNQVMNAEYKAQLDELVQHAQESVAKWQQELVETEVAAAAPPQVEEEPKKEETVQQEVVATN